MSEYNTRQWEYKRVYQLGDWEQDTESLNQLGKERWEVIAANQDSYLLKRELQPTSLSWSGPK